MTDGSRSPGSGQDERTVIGVPDPHRGDTGDLDEGLVTPRDLGSASRSCLAIIVLLLVILLLLCVFFTVQTFR